MARREDGYHIRLDDEHRAAIRIDDHYPKRQFPAKQSRSPSRRQRIQHARRPRRDNIGMVAARRGKLGEVQDIH